MELNRAIDQVVEIISPLVEQKKYLRNFYDKAAVLVSQLYPPHSSLIFSSLILSRFTNALVKSRPLTEIGAEQVNTYSSEVQPNS